MSPHRFALVYAFGSALIGAGELIVGLLSGSLALVADSVHSLSDSISGVVGAIASRVATEKADKNHPFGHGRAEPLGAFFVAIINGLLGLNIIQSSVGRLAAGSEPHHSYESLVVVGVVLFFKTTFFLIGKYGMKRTPTVRALTVDSRNDALATTLTLVIIAASWWKIPYVDAGFAALIGVIIIYSGFAIAKDNIALLMGEVPHPEFFDAVDEVLGRIPQVRDYRHLRAHYVGTGIHLAITIRLDPHLTLKEGHAIEHEVMSQLQSITGLDEVFVHTEPHTPGETT